VPEVVMYSTRVCPYCIRAERLLNSKQITPKKIMIDHNTMKMQEMIKKTGRRTVPQIFIGDIHVGGYDDLATLEEAGKLDEMLQD
jgi:glutaredoxin 3